MSLISWDRTLSVGIESIDQQHQILIQLINDLHTAMRTGSGKQVVGEILENLVTYTKTHFSNEETLLKKHNYPQLPGHINEHNQLTQKVDDLLKRHLNGEMAITLEVMGFLKNWLTHHILETDKLYTAFLKSKI
jgi:hemerythrin-like metal-binding protein